MRLDRNPVLGLEDSEIQCRYDGSHGGGTGLIAANLDAIDIGRDVIGMVNHPIGQPECLLVSASIVWARFIHFPADHV